MSDGPAVAKTVWTEADFGAMDWHDNAIHAIAVEPVPDNPGRLLVDLDYIVEWVSPTSPPTTLDFWTLSGDRFTIEVGSPGFTQYLRRPPIFSDGPWLPVEERGGFSFAREAYRIE